MKPIKWVNIGMSLFILVFLLLMSLWNNDWQFSPKVIVAVLIGWIMGTLLWLLGMRIMKRKAEKKP